MTAIASVTANRGIGPVDRVQPAALKTDAVSFEAENGAQFRAILEKKMHGMKDATTHPVDSNKASLGDKILSKATSMAGELKNDQAYVSKMLEQATRNSDSMQLMRAMMALNDYQMRVQFISKTASKATQALDQLTKLQ